MWYLTPNPVIFDLITELSKKLKPVLFSYQDLSAKICYLHALNPTAMWFKTHMTRWVKLSIRSQNRQNRQMTGWSYLKSIFIVGWKDKCNIVLYSQDINCNNTQVFWFALLSTQQHASPVLGICLMPNATALEKSTSLRTEVGPQLLQLSVSKMLSTNFPVGLIQ